MSAIWKYFDPIKDDNGTTVAGKCKIPSCQKVLKYNGTSSMRNHVTKVHKLSITSEKGNSNILTTTIELVQPAITENFPPLNHESLNATIARLCAQDGLTFLVLATSKTIRKLIKDGGYENLPESPNTINNCVKEFSKEVIELYKNEISKELQSISLLAVSFDEWTSINNKRYMNVILHSANKQWNLGLVRIEGKTNASLSNSQLLSQLEKFDVSFSNLICMMSDGAAINGCMAKEVHLIQQECLAHGVQLAVKKALYSEKDSEKESDSSEDELQDELGLLAFENAFPNFTPRFNQPEISSAITKVRNIVKYFRKSPVRNDALKSRIKEDIQKVKNLILDSRTRWSSLNKMLTRYYEVREPITYILHVLNKNELAISTEEQQTIHSIISALTPIEQCVNSLCRKECTLYEAHLSIEVALDELNESNTELAVELHNLIIQKLSSRFSKIYFVQLYLEDKLLIENPKYFLAMPSKRMLLKTMKEIIKKASLLEESESSFDSQNDTNFASQTSSESSFYDKVEAKKNQPNNTKGTVEQRLIEEVNLYEESNYKGVLLQKVLAITKTVSPTTTDCERAFSVAGYFCNKIRSRMSDETLSTLCLLKSYFNSN